MARRRTSRPDTALAARRTRKQGRPAGAEREPLPSFRTVLKDRDVQILIGARASSKLAQSTVSYGSMVYLAASGARQWEISLVAAASYLAAVLFGLQGGSLSDSLSKRVAIIAGYVGLGGLCFAVPIFLGTGVRDLMLLTFLSSIVMQLVTPSLKAAVALVATPAAMATVASLVSMGGSAASALGSSALAPLLIKITSIDILLYIAGVIYLLGAIRAFRLPREPVERSAVRAILEVDWRPEALSLSGTSKWIVRQRHIASMVLVGAMVVSMFEAFSTLIPVYVRDVLDADPTNAVYIFAPAGVGFLIGTLFAPRLIHLIGERNLAIVSVFMLGGSMMLFGAIDAVAPTLAPYSPIRPIACLLGVDVNDKVLAASLIAIPANFGSTAAGGAVQAYINRRVPVIEQGATFGFQEVQENAMTLVTILTLGLISGIVGSQIVFLFAPVVILGIVIWLIRFAYEKGLRTEVSRRTALRALVNREGDGEERPARRRAKAKRRKR